MIKKDVALYYNVKVYIKIFNLKLVQVFKRIF